MAKIRINPEELELLEEDQKPSSVSKLQEFVRDNQQIIGGVVIVILLIVAFVSYSDYSEQKETISANIEFSDAFQSYSDAQSSTTWATQERQDAMLEVVAQAETIMSKYPDSQVALEAEYLKGTAYYQAGDNIDEIINGGARNNQQAIDTFTSYLQKVPEGSFEFSRGAIALAYAHENNFFVTNDEIAFNEAVNYYNQAEAADPYGFIRVDALLGRARLLSETRDGEEEAIAIYRQILEERFQPMEIPADLQNPDGSPNVGKQIYFNYQQFNKLSTSLTNTARIELSRLGVDVDEEYPIYDEDES